MSIASAQAVAVTFTTQGTDGASANADSTPTATLYLNGTANAASVTVTNVATGLYKAAVTLPTLTAGMVAEIVVTATVGGTVGKGVIWRDTQTDVRYVNGEAAEPVDSIALSGNGPYAINESGGVGAGDVAATIDLTLSGTYSAWATDALQYTDASSNPVEGLTIRAFEKTGYDDGERQIAAMVTSDADGRWSPSMDLASGDYYIVADTNGDGFLGDRVSIRVP